MLHRVGDEDEEEVGEGHAEAEKEADGGFLAVRSDGERHADEGEGKGREREGEALVDLRPAEAGIDQLLCLLNPYKIPHKSVLHSVELLGKHVIPAVR